MRVCYLDFDGVLHNEAVYFLRSGQIVMSAPGCRLFEWQQVLVELLAPHPEVKLVLSTAWVRARSFDYAKRQLQPLLQERIVGATFHHRHMDAHSFSRAPRGIQIWGDVLRRMPLDWFAIDDDGFGWPAWCRGKLIQTHGDKGLSDTGVQERIRARLESWAH